MIPVITNAGNKAVFIFQDCLSHNSTFSLSIILHSFLITAVLSVSKVLIVLIFLNHRNFETEVDMPEKRGIKSLDPQEIWQCDLGFFVVSLSVPKLRRFQIDEAINTFETASTYVQHSDVHK